jgi:UDP-N-acetylglucosamine diphosphorylase / glucose-1-phosphate thymidylyltransferase / UDP-N-acetylgalactosamine diphosphorylase / glucosamine-1-phosphate N-acetyltransferase / galactosamine-1-phosphate N-acetyltransferase
MAHPELAALAFFDLAATDHAALFDGTTYVWDALLKIEDYIRDLLATNAYAPNAGQINLPPTVVVEGEVYIAPDAQISHHAYIQGPSFIGPGAQVRQGAFVRKGTLLAAKAVVGHATETKNAALLEGAQAPHFAYVGDSILGRGVNLGAGTKLSNFPMNADKDPVTGKRPTIVLSHNGERIDTEIVKFGAIMGDGVGTGCNCVTNPGTVVGPRTLVYTLAMLRKGIYPADSIIKLRQTQEIVERR